MPTNIELLWLSGIGSSETQQWENLDDRDVYTGEYAIVQGK